jgi:transposase
MRNMMIKINQWENIKTAYEVYGKKIREIARETGHSRNTIKKVLKKEYTGYSKRREQPYPVLGPYLKIIDSWLEEDKDKLKKQWHTGVRIYNRLRAEKGYSGSISTVLHYVKKAR